MSKQKIKVVEAAVVVNKFSPSGKAAKCVVKIKDDVLHPTLFIEPTDKGVYRVSRFTPAQSPNDAVTEDIEKAVTEYLAKFGPKCGEVPKDKPDEKKPDIDEVIEAQVKAGGGLKK